jgi:aminoglycoside phosphotransferase (APT) family kinase protein
LPDTATAVIHGDPGAGNIRMADGRVGLLDWDEARVDTPLLDLGALPPDSALPLAGVHRLVARRAALAWEVACCWTAEPAYARRRLAQLSAALRA